MKKCFFSLLLFLAFSLPVFAVTDICDISIGPDAKAADFANGQDVTVTMGYVTDEAAGVRIYARPFSGGSPAPGYAASGSPLYNGSGTANSSFTITTGTVVVDEIRIEVYASDNVTLLRRLWVPVRFRFGNVGVNQFSYSHAPELASFLLGESFSTSFQYNVSYPGGVRIFIRPMTDGALTPGYSASGSGVYSGSGSASSNFTINSGQNVHVDALRVRVVNADQTVDIDEFFLPVNLYFSTARVTGITAQGGNFPFNNEDRQINFDYSTTESSGIRIFARPWTNGDLTPGYAASGSGVYTGSGSGSGTFTITSGNQRVDHVRFRVTNADQTQTLLEMWSPVEYTFGNFLVENIVFCPAWPARLEHSERVNIHYNIYNDEGQNARIFVLPFSNGAPTPSYAVSGSPVYATGSGEANDFFRISSGDVVVDQLRFRITTEDQSAQLAEYFVPVHYVYGNPTSSTQEESSLLEAMSIAPNPAGDRVQVYLSLRERASVRVQVVDLAGKVVRVVNERELPAETIEPINIETSGLAPGFYFVVAEGKNFRQTQKLVVE
ncbi:MAG: T9SS type A sorting domain-containing protein [Saprospiraceae bacterium]|nr:T9SS type A sorting domain-containing protein [Saprospiraceae bacterium]